MIFIFSLTIFPAALTAAIPTTVDIAVAIIQERLRKPEQTGAELRAVCDNIYCY